MLVVHAPAARQRALITVLLLLLSLLGMLLVLVVMMMVMMMLPRMPHRMPPITARTHILQPLKALIRQGIIMQLKVQLIRIMPMSMRVHVHKGPIRAERALGGVPAEVLLRGRARALAHRAVHGELRAAALPARGGVPRLAGDGAPRAALALGAEEGRAAVVVGVVGGLGQDLVVGGGGHRGCAGTRQEVFQGLSWGASVS